MYMAPLVRSSDVISATMYVVSTSFLPLHSLIYREDPVPRLAADDLFILAKCMSKEESIFSLILFIRVSVGTALV